MYFNGMHILYCTDNVNEKKDQHADTNKKTGNQNYKICRNGFDGDGKHCNDQANQHQFVFPVFFLSHIQTESQENQREGDCKNHVGARQSFNKISSASQMKNQTDQKVTKCRTAKVKVRLFITPLLNEICIKKYRDRNEHDHHKA